MKYSVSGIKTLEGLVSLSFYKKTITKNLGTQKYNIKGIYGVNGSGKTAIITSVDILKNIITDTRYLSNHFVQQHLEEIINKKTKELFIEIEYLDNSWEDLRQYMYSVTISKDNIGKYVISHEILSYKKATSKSSVFETIFEISNGKIISLFDDNNNGFRELLNEKTINLLSTSSMSSVFFEKIVLDDKKDEELWDNSYYWNIFCLLAFGINIFVYLDNTDDHKNFLLNNTIRHFVDVEKNFDDFSSAYKRYIEMEDEGLNVISTDRNYIPIKQYNQFEKKVDQLYKFISIFKSDLVDIQIDKKEDENYYVCDLVMVYNSYNIYAEFESTGIKKLIKLFAYLAEMVDGKIVFIDELDSNIHDVYLCALLEYLMEYGKGQLCFTTHNVGPMDVLKKNNMSIDFLSEDNKIYSWKKMGIILHQSYIGMV